ncbi:glycosyltransferase [Deinococcus cellulosilyticus]|uniref:Uncharacterized protein n=1 Tax=Deinococcus cellulosilyticus (strain DSM 18568 / NBRC 106333 / KACC 11606 / 5516J-15) TaxID=1223518 RepID=A0A511MY20_DEIC1|nr:glycosyltransferase [Deinococcus cellulosilyticus]GEM45480.1 hypothetical protein DC3_11150 [Deinococcus cellulosilyticus NBRC 106333 = KACC 11606]
MIIAIFALGTQGDVQPYLALGSALIQQGHTVRLITHTNYQQQASALGFEVWPVEGNVQEVAESEEMRKLLQKGNMLEINRYTSRLMEEVVLGWARDSLNACEGADLLMAGMGGGSLARALSEKLNVPFIEAHVVPMTPTRAFPGVLLPAGGPRLGGTVNLLSHHLVQQVMWQSFRSADQKMRQSVLKLPAAPFFGPKPQKRHPQPPVLYGISPHVLPRPADWPSHIHMTGFWFLDAPSWQPPAELQNFLDSGPTPIYVGFGSMGNRDPEQTADLVLEALQTSGQRAVLLKGWGGMVRGDLPDFVHLSGSVPHSWLFPRMRAVVHHGGAGTTAAGLGAGVPSQVVPFFGDQPFWGNRVQMLGVGPAPIPRKNLTAQKLADSIQRMVSDVAMQQKAVTLGQVIQTENGPMDAVAIIEQHVAESAQLH